MLPRLKPACFYDLVIEVAIVRPGPIQGGMVHPYLKRRQGLEPVTYPSAAVKGVLERTLGIPIFQEQVMQLAIVAAGFTPGEADHLRRSMAAWRRKGGLEKFEQRLVDGMGARGYAGSLRRQIYQQILGFGEYGFPESHSASFALLVYVSAWLKRHEPAAFCAALLNSQPMGFYAPAQLVQDARRHGVEVRRSTSRSATGIARSSRTRCASACAWSAACPKPARSASSPRARRAVRARGRSRPSRAARPARPGRARRGRRAGRPRRPPARGGWDVAGVEKLPPLLAGATFDEAAADLPAPTEGQDIVADYRALGLTLGRHPLALLRGQLRARRLLTSAEVRDAPHGRIVRTAGIVIGRQRPDTASGVVFVTLEDETGAINVIVWRDLCERQRRELLGARLMAVYGRVEREGIVVHLIAGHLVDLSPLLGSLPTRSRDFH